MDLVSTFRYDCFVHNQIVMGLPWSVYILLSKDSPIPSIKGFRVDENFFGRNGIKFLKSFHATGLLSNNDPDE